MHDFYIVRQFCMRIDTHTFFCISIGFRAFIYILTISIAENFYGMNVCVYFERRLMVLMPLLLQRLLRFSSDIIVY